MHRGTASQGSKCHFSSPGHKCRFHFQLFVAFCALLCKHSDYSWIHKTRNDESKSVYFFGFGNFFGLEFALLVFANLREALFFFTLQMTKDVLPFQVNLRGSGVN